MTYTVKRVSAEDRKKLPTPKVGQATGWWGGHRRPSFWRSSIPLHYRRARCSRVGT